MAHVSVSLSVLCNPCPSPPPPPPPFHTPSPPPPPPLVKPRRRASLRNRMHVKRDKVQRIKHATDNTITKWRKEGKSEQADRQQANDKSKTFHPFPPRKA